MTNPDVFRSSFRAMTDGEIIDRWSSQQMTMEARSIAEQELRARGIDPESINADEERQRQSLESAAFRRGQTQRALRMSVRLILTIVAAVLSAFGAAVAALMLR